MSEDPREEFRQRNLKQWKSFLHELFPKDIPQSKTWTNRMEIISILNKIGSKKSMNHLFLPTGGGLDLTGAKISHEENCIELLFGRTAHIVKPKYLTFESFGKEYEWNYFRLESYELKPTGVYKTNSYDREELAEITPLKYVERSIWDQGFYGYDEHGNEISLPKSARVVIRNLAGSFVIFAKGSIYNKTPGTYDARHNQMDSIEFREHIEEAINYLREK